MNINNFLYENPSLEIEFGRHSPHSDDPNGWWASIYESDIERRDAHWGTVGHAATLAGAISHARDVRDGRARADDRCPIQRTYISSDAEESRSLDHRPFWEHFGRGLNAYLGFNGAVVAFRAKLYLSSDWYHSIHGWNRALS